MATPAVNNAVHVQAIMKGVAPYDDPDITTAITALIMSPEDLPTLTVQRILAAFVLNKENQEDIMFDYPDLKACDHSLLNQLHSKNAEHFKAFYRRYRPVIVDARIRSIMDY